MATGFALGLLKFSKDVNKLADPAYKVHPKGFLAKLLVSDDPTAIEYDAGQGHLQPVKVKRKQRFTIDQVADYPSCDNTNTNPYIEQTVSVTGFRQLAFTVRNETIAQFGTYASQNVSGNPDLMYEFWDTLRTAADALLTAVNRDLVTTALANLGDHRATGTAAAVTLNIPLSTATIPLNEGINKLKYDFMYNAFSGVPQVVGGGKFAQFMMNQPAKSADQSGLNTRIQAAGIDFWYDEDINVVASAPDNIFVYEKDAVQLIEYKRYRGNMWDGVPGPSKFGGLVITMLAFDGVNVRQVPVYFDWQLKFSDCAEEFSYVDGAESVMLQPGYNLILSKTFDLFTIPTTGYRSGDVLEGNRGSLRYNVTNA